MKFLVLRTDLKIKLRYIRLLVVDTEIFTQENDKFTEKIEADRLNSLISANFHIVFCSDSTNGNYADLLNSSEVKYISLDGLSYHVLIDRLCYDYGINNNEIAFINITETDHGLLSSLNFSATTIDAPLEIKTNSYYVSNFTGSDTFNEIIRIISSAKSS